jgi:hypothetical protein
MNAVLRLLTSRKTTFVSVLVGITLLLADVTVLQALRDLGLGDVFVDKLVAAGKLIALALAALGYSPLKRPTTPDESGAATGG